MELELALAVRYTIKYATGGDKASTVMLVANQLTGEGWGAAHAWDTAEKAYNLV